MADIINPLLNNAVNLYVQAIDYRRIPTSQIPALVGAGIQSLLLESVANYKIIFLYYFALIFCML